MRGHIFHIAGIAIYVLPPADRPILYTRPGIVSLTRRESAHATRQAIARGLSSIL